MKTKLLGFDFITQGHIINKSIDPRGNNNPPHKKVGGGGQGNPTLNIKKIIKLIIVETLLN